MAYFDATFKPFTRLKHNSLQKFIIRRKNTILVSVEHSYKLATPRHGKRVHFVVNLTDTGANFQKVDVSIFDSTLSSTRRSQASEKKKLKIACPLLDVFAFGQVSSPQLYRLNDMKPSLNISKFSFFHQHYIYR